MDQLKSLTDSLLTAYRTAFASSQQGFCLLEEIPTPATDPPDFRYLWTNAAFDQQGGLTQAVGQTIRQLVPQLEAHILDYYHSVAQTGQPIQFETFVNALDRWIAADVFRVGTFEPPRIGVLFTNITERKRREADLAFLADVSQDLAQLIHIDQTMNALGQKIGAYLALSACVFGELFGHNQAQIAQLSHGWNRADSPSLLGTYQMSEFMSLEMIQMCRRAEAIVIRDVFTDPKTNGPQYAAINIGSFVGIPFVRDGDWRFLLVVYRSEAHDWSPAEIELIRELMTRIWTRLERARAEAALLASEAGFRIITQAAPALVWVCSATGENIYFNARWQEYTGQTAEQASGYGWTTTMYPDDAAYILPYWQHSQQTGEPYEGQVRYQRHDGLYRWHVFRALPRRDGAGQIQAWYGVSVDIDDAKQAQQALQLANQRKDEFLAMLAHELRNPLTPVRTGLQVLSLTGSDEPTLNSLLPIMNRQMDHVMRLVDDLLDVSRISRGKIELQTEPLDLTSVVDQAAQAIGPLYETAGRQLQVSLPTAPLPLLGDATRLHQVVTNLLTNGLRYTRDNRDGEPGQVWLSLEQVADEAVLRVGDNGIGLAADQLQAIFGLFVQVDTSLARSNSGLGLGLTLVQQLVELHGGRIEAFSPGLEQGSEFVIHLPVMLA